VIHPREIFYPAVQDNAVAIIVAHNHPSGNLEPSKEDIEITDKVKKAGEIMGIQLLDHLIISKNGLFSLSEAGKL
jgi:DNA repair protein RadC